MKYLVYFLVLANFAYLGWNIHLRQTAGEVARELPAFPAGVTPLVTLKEIEEQQQHAEGVSAVDVLTTSQPPGAGTALTCRAIGPFQSAEDLLAVAEQLQVHGVQAEQRTAEIQNPNGFWVYLPAMERDRVLQVVKVLDENRDREYYVGKGNFLALGTFVEKSRAEIRVEQVRKLGFDPVLEARYQTSIEYWLDTDVQTSAASELDVILQDHPALELQDIACP